jgi:hypothetical protein
MEDQRDDREGDGIRFRKLRIAFFTTCLIAGALLIVLWVRSIWWVDSVNLPLWGNKLISVGTVSGTVGISYAISDCGLTYATMPADEYTKLRITSNLSPISPALGHISTAGWGFEMFIPDWFLLIAVMAMAAAPWTRRCSRQFSLRTLLIVTTLMAIALGTLVYVGK